MDVPMHEKTSGNRTRFAALLIAASLGMTACDSGREGVAYVRQSDGDIGDPISNVELSFIAEDGSGVHRVSTEPAGTYEISLDEGRYVVTATHPDFEDYTTSPGFVVVEGGSKGTFNVFLREPVATTVFVVRHAEKIHPDSNAAETPLSPEGAARAVALSRTLDEVGVTGVYSTPTVRTEGTVGPLAEVFAIPIENYTDPAALAAEVLSQHRGDVVAVAGHSNTVAAVVAAFGAPIQQGSIGDYDNLYMVTVPESGDPGVVNLQYGEDTTPDIAKTQVAATTVLLVEADAAGASAQSARFEHVLRKAGPSVLAVEPGLAVLDGLAGSTGLTVQTLSGNSAAAIADLVSDNPGEVLVVALGSAGLTAALEGWGATPPVSFNGDVGPLIAVTLLPDRPVVRYLRY